jgi:hypothetical protein
VRHLLKTLRKSIPHLTTGSGLRLCANLLRPLLTFRGSSHRLSTIVVPITGTNREISPGNAHPPSRLCPPHLRPCVPCKYWALKKFARMAASYVIPVRQACALPAASFRFHLAMDTLAVRLTVPLTGSVGNFHSKVDAPCRAHKFKAGSLLTLPY